MRTPKTYFYVEKQEISPIFLRHKRSQIARTISASKYSISQLRTAHPAAMTHNPQTIKGGMSNERADEANYIVLPAPCL